MSQIALSIRQSVNLKRWFYPQILACDMFYTSFLELQSGVDYLIKKLIDRHLLRLDTFSSLNLSVIIFLSHIDHMENDIDLIRSDVYKTRKLLSSMRSHFPMYKIFTQFIRTNLDDI